MESFFWLIKTGNGMMLWAHKKNEKYSNYMFILLTNRFAYNRTIVNLYVIAQDPKWLMCFPLQLLISSLGGGAEILF